MKKSSIVTILGFFIFCILPIYEASAYVPHESTDVTITHRNYPYHTPASAISNRPTFHVNTGTPAQVDHDLTIHNLQPTLDRNVNSGVGTKPD